MLKELIYLTGNSDKSADASKYLRIPIKPEDVRLVELQSLDLSEIVRDKATKAFSVVKRSVLVEDVSLTFEALGKFPGPFIKWFYEALGSEGLCRLLDNYDNRSACASVTYGLHTGSDIRLFEGQINGRIAGSPKGNWFAWSNIFIPDGYDLTWAEMNEDLRSKTSMRRIALSKMHDFLNIQ